MSLGYVCIPYVSGWGPWVVHRRSLAPVHQPMWCPQFLLDSVSVSDADSGDLIVGREREKGIKTKHTYLHRLE